LKISVEENISHMIAYNAKIVVTGQNLKKNGQHSFFS